MKKIWNFVLPTVLALTTNLSAMAHEVHGQENTLSPRSYVVNEERLFPIALVAIVIGSVIRTYFMKRTRTIKEK
jgi:hypothetical protein